MFNKPTSDQQPHRSQNRRNGKPILPRPPQRQQETNPERNTRDLTGHDIEPAKDKQGTDERGAQVASGQGDGADTAAHVRDTALARVERDGFNPPARAAGCDCVAEFVEGDDEHLYTHTHKHPLVRKEETGVSAAAATKALIGALELLCLRTHLERPQRPAHIRQIPQQCDNNHVADNHAQCCLLRAIHAQIAA